MYKSIDLKQQVSLSDAFVYIDVHNLVDVEGQEEGLLLDVVRLELEVGNIGVLSLGTVLDGVRDFKSCQLVKVWLRSCNVLEWVEVETC